jgi:glyoxylate reductase
VKPAVFVHTWAPDDVLADLRERYEVDYVNTIEAGYLPAEKVAEHAAGKAGILVLLAPVVADVFKANAGTLKAVASVSVGVDNIDVPAATEAGVQVTNTAGVLDDAVADMAIGLLLAAGRRIVEADRYTRAGKFQGSNFELFWGAKVKGETLGIVGLGRIGRAVAQRAKGFGLNIVYHNRNRVDAAIEREFGVTYLSLEDLLKQSRYVILLTPLTPETTHMINAERLALMRNDGFLINISRGPVVHEEALLAALQTGQIAGAALDVYEFEPKVSPGLMALENVVLLPHIASGDVETRHAMVRVAAENLTAALNGEAVPNPVNKIA